MPLFGFPTQPRLRFIGHGTSRSDESLRELTLSYAFIADPDHPDSPSNLRPDVRRIDAALRRAEQTGQPAWLLERLQHARYPTLWEAVATVAVQRDDPRSPAEHLADHINHVLINTFEGRRRTVEQDIPELDQTVQPAHVQDSVLLVDGISTPAIVIDTDPDVAGWAVQADRALVLVVLPRAHVDRIQRNLVTIPAPSIDA